MDIKIYIIFYSCLFTLIFSEGEAQNIALIDGMVIDSSITVSKEVYKFSSKGMEDPVITIKGDNITVDFNGSVLLGNKPKTLPDSFDGLAIKVEGENIVIKNVVAKGYKVGLLAENSNGIKISYCNFSYNYRQHLRSNLRRENITDWLSHHDNEKNQWLEYGAGIYLNNCDHAIVNYTTVTGGQNGLLITGCESGIFYNNNFSFNSGLGIGLYRSSGNKVMHNKLDWNVRGYSHGIYNRGQDSAGILVYEQSNENIFAYNSVTHSGDGFFLWAGNHTLESGEGGCNDNLIYGNDFSHAPTNGVEITFSRNFVINNRIEECDHGVWAGYSYNTRIVGNTFKNNNRSIAWEMGNNNIIKFNRFKGENTAIWIWENFPKNLGFANHRNVSSRNYTISKNIFIDNDLALNIKNTEHVLVNKNVFIRNKELIESDSSDLKLYNNIKNPKGGFNGTERNKIPKEVKLYAPPPINDGMDAMLPEDSLRGRKYILVDEWGPYDFRSPAIWLRKNSNGKLEFEILGSKGSWKIKKTEGIIELKAKEGKVPGKLTAYIKDEPIMDIYIELVFIGEGLTDRFGNKFEQGTPFTFTFSLYDQPMDWQVKWFRFKNKKDLKLPGFKDIIKDTPIAKERTSYLGYRWWGSPAKKVSKDFFITTAESSVKLEEGLYRLSLTSDNRVRLYLDGKLIMDRWEPHSPQYREMELKLGGKHNLRIEHYDLTGFSTLAFDLKPIREKYFKKSTIIEDIWK